MFALFYLLKATTTFLEFPRILLGFGSWSLPMFGPYPAIWTRIYHLVAHTCSAKTQYRKYETNVPRKGKENFHIHMSVSDVYIYSQGSVWLFCCRKICGPIMGLYRHMNMHGYWDWGREFIFCESINRIFVAVWVKKEKKCSPHFEHRWWQQTCRYKKEGCNW